MTFRVRWEGPLYEPLSLAHVNRSLAAALARDPRFTVEVAPTPLDNLACQYPEGPRLLSLRNETSDSADIVVRMSYPPEKSPPTQGRCVIYFPWEFVSPPRDMVPLLVSGADDVWAPSDWTAVGFLRAGVQDERLFVLPHGVDPTVFHPQDARFARARLGDRRR